MNYNLLIHSSPKITSLGIKYKQLSNLPNQVPLNFIFSHLWEFYNTFRGLRQLTVFLETNFTACRNNSISLVAQTVKRLSTMRETRVLSLGREDPWGRKWQSTPVLLPGKSHGQRSLVGYSPGGHRESDMTKQLHKLYYLFNYSDMIPKTS